MRSNNKKSAEKSPKPKPAETSRSYTNITEYLSHLAPIHHYSKLEVMEQFEPFNFNGISKEDFEKFLEKFDVMLKNSGYDLDDDIENIDCFSDFYKYLGQFANKLNCHYDIEYEELMRFTGDLPIQETNIQSINTYWVEKLIDILPPDIALYLDYTCFVILQRATKVMHYDYHLAEEPLEYKYDEEEEYADQIQMWHKLNSYTIVLYKKFIKDKKTIVSPCPVMKGRPEKEQQIIKICKFLVNHNEYMALQFMPVKFYLQCCGESHDEDSEEMSHIATQLIDGDGEYAVDAYYNAYYVLTYDNGNSSLIDDYCEFLNQAYQMNEWYHEMSKIVKVNHKNEFIPVNKKAARTVVKYHDSFGDLNELLKAYYDERVGANNEACIAVDSVR